MVSDKNSSKSTGDQSLQEQDLPSGVENLAVSLRQDIGRLWVDFNQFYVSSENLMNSGERLLLEPGKFDPLEIGKPLRDNDGYAHLQYSVSPASCKPFSPIVDMLAAYISHGWIKRLTVMVATYELHYVHFLYHPDVIKIRCSTEEETEQKKREKAYELAQQIDQRWWSDNEVGIERLVDLCFRKGVWFDVQRWGGLWEPSSSSRLFSKIRMLRYREGVQNLQLPEMGHKTLYNRYLRFVETVLGDFNALSQSTLEALDCDYPELPNVAESFYKAPRQDRSSLEKVVVLEKEKSFKVLLLTGLRSTGFFKNMPTDWSSDTQANYKEGVVRVLKYREEPSEIFGDDDSSRSCFDEACWQWWQELGGQKRTDFEGLLAEVRAWVGDILIHEETFLMREIAGRMAMMSLYTHQSEGISSDKYSSFELYYGNTLGIVREWFDLLRKSANKESEQIEQVDQVQRFGNSMVLIRPFSFSEWLKILIDGLEKAAKRRNRKDNQGATSAQKKLMRSAETHMQLLATGVVEREENVVGFDSLSTAERILNLQKFVTGSMTSEEDSETLPDEVCSYDKCDDLVGEYDGTVGSAALSNRTSRGTKETISYFRGSPVFNEKDWVDCALDESGGMTVASTDEFWWNR